MSNISHRFYLVVAILILSCLAGIKFYVFTPAAQNQGKNIADFPAKIGDWTSDDIPLSQDLYDTLETRNLIVRNYKNPQGGSILLYMVYSPNNRKISQPPEICLEQPGVTVTKKQPLQITPLIRATGLILEREKTRDYVVYWYRAGKENLNSYIAQQSKIIINSIKGQVTSVGFIRLNATIGESGPEETLAKLKSFCSLLEPLLSINLP